MRRVGEYQTETNSLSESLLEHANVFADRYERQTASAVRSARSELVYGVLLTLHRSKLGKLTMREIWGKVLGDVHSQSLSC